MILATGSNRERMSVGVDDSRAIARISPAQQDLHRNFAASARALKKDLVQTIYYLAMIREQNIHKLLGFGTIVEYAQEVAGFRPRQTRAFLSIAQSLPEYEMVQQALSRGELTLGKAKVIVDNSSPAEQAQSLEKALGASEKGLRESLQKRKPAPRPGGSSPPASASPKVHAGKLRRPEGVEYHHVTLKFTTEELARWASLMENNREKKSREQRILEGLSRRTQSGGNGPPYLVVLLTCPTCGKTSIPTNRGELPAGESAIAASGCDATVEDATGSQRRTIPPRLRRLALQRAGHRCESAGCNNTQFLEIHHRVPVAHGGRTELENLLVLCWKCHQEAHQAEDAARVSLRMAPKSP